MLRATLRRLEVFVAAVESGGFRACSDRLEISQAAVSHHIKHLEDELGYELFVRRRGSVAGVTQRGVAAYRQAKDLLEDAGRLERLDGAAPGRDGRRRLRVQADSVLDALLAKRITAFLAGRWLFDVDLTQSHFEQMTESYSRGHADIIYFYAWGPVPEFDSTLCWHEPISICARHDHPLLRDGPVEIAALARHPFIAPPNGCHFRRSIDRMLGQAGLEGYPIAAELGHANMAREAVISGVAISAVITRYLDEELSRFGVRAVPLQGPRLTVEVRRAMRRELALDPQVQRLTDYLDRGPAASAPPADLPERQAVAMAS